MLAQGHELLRNILDNQVDFYKVSGDVLAAWTQISDLPFDQPTNRHHDHSIRSAQRSAPCTTSWTTPCTPSTPSRTRPTSTPRTCVASGKSEPHTSRDRDCGGLAYLHTDSHEHVETTHDHSNKLAEIDAHYEQGR